MRKHKSIVQGIVARASVHVLKRLQRTDIRTILCLALIPFIFTCVLGQTIPGKGDFRFTADIARFYGDSTQLYIEVYYGIRENTLTYMETPNAFTGSVNMALEVKRESVVVATKQWAVPHSCSDTSALSKGQQMIGIEAVALPPGEYTMHLSGYDVNNPLRRDSIIFPLPLQKFSTEKEMLSDVELCTSIQQSTDKQSVFYKNTLEVIPNASKLYGAGLPIVYFYVEAYNLAKDSAKENVVVRTSVLDAAGKEVLFHDKVKSRLHNSSVEIGTMNVSALRSGTYFFRVTLVDSTKNILAASGKRMFIYKPGTVPDSTQSLAAAQLSAEYAFLTDSMIDLEFEQAKYIRTSTEETQYAQLNDLKAKQQFLFEFWRRRDVDPTTPVNDMREQYRQRIEYAATHFQSWRSDRGRVHILFGLPDEVERFPSTSESLPYEIWHYYNLQGGVIFVFVDRTGMGEYILVHSTHRNELRDENWYTNYAHRTQ